MKIKLSMLIFVLMSYAVTAFAGLSPSFTLGTVTAAPGQTVQVPITFVSNGNQVVTPQIDVKYDNTLLSTPTAVLGSSALTETLNYNNALAPNVVRMLLFDNNVTPLSDGPQVVLTFTVSPTAIDGTVIPITFNTNPILASDPLTNDITVPGVNGQINVVTIKAPQVISSVAFSPATLAVGGSSTVSATGGGSGNPVTFTSTTTGVCTATGSNGATITALTAGTCSITANQAGNSGFAPATAVVQPITVAPGAQTIGAIGFTPSTLTVGGTTTASATGGASGNAVTFGTSTPTVCSVSGTNNATITPIIAGVCTITANQLGNANYNAAAQTSNSITVAAASQTINSMAFTPPTLAVGGSTTAIAIGGLSGNPVTFSSLTPTVCSAGGTNGSTISALTVGTCTIAANQAGNAGFSAATQTTLPVTVTQGSQAITLGAAPSVVVRGTGSVSVTAKGASTSPVVLTSTTTAVCTVSGTTVTGVTAGPCSITASQAGDANYAAATPVVLPLTVGKGTQTIAFSAAPTVNVGGTGAVSATGAPSTTPVLLTSTTPLVCTISGPASAATIQGVTAGTCIIAGNQAADANNNIAATVNLTFTVGKASQVISFGTAPSIAVNGSGTVAATGGASTSPVLFTSSTPAVCSVSGPASGATVLGLTAGTCTIAANQAGDANFNAAALTNLNIAIGKAGQAISFGTAPVLVAGSTGVQSVTGGGSTSPVLLTSTTPAVCTVSGTTVTAVFGGSCVLAANQAADANYNAAAQVTQSISVAITFPGAPTAVSAVPGNTVATVSFLAPAFTGGATLSGYTVTSNPAGGVDSNAGSSALSHSVTGLTNGTSYTFTVKATNAKGDSVASSASSAVIPNLLTPSLSAPTATLVKAGGSVAYTVSYTGADIVTLANADVTVITTGNASATAAVTGSGTATRTVTLSGLTGDGTVGISIKAGTASAASGAINAAPSLASATFTVDNTAPALVINPATLPDGTKTSSNTLSITGSASDASGVQSVSVNGGTPLTLTGGAFNTAITLALGSNTVTVVATDNAGNTTSDTRTIVYDNVAPALTFSAPTPTDGFSTNVQTVTVAGTASKAGSVTITLNNDNPIVLTTSGATNSFTSQAITLVAGVNTISITASDTDTPPNVASAQTRTVTFDITKPVLAISEPAADVTTTFASLLVQGTESDNFGGSTLAATVDGVAVTPAPALAADGSFQLNVSFSDAKTYQVVVTATDLAGNFTPVTRNIVYRPFSIADALRSLQIASGIEVATAADSARLDVGPLSNGLPAKDGVIDLSDTIVLLRLVVGDLAGITW